MALTDDDYHRINTALRRLYALQDLDDFVVTSMLVLPELIESNAAAYNEVDYAARRMMTVINSHPMQTHYHEIQLLFESTMHQNPLIEHYRRVNDGPKKISDFLSQEEWRGTGLYQSFYRPFRGEHQIAVALPVEGPSLVAFAFNRGESDFTEDDREILTFMQPHLAQSFLNARQHTSMKSALKRSEQVLETIGAGWIDLDATLRITQQTAFAEANLSLFFDYQPMASDRLPHAVERWVSEHLAAPSSQAPAPLVVSNRIGRLIIRLVPTGSADGCTLLTERFTLAASPQPFEQLGLTRRQAEVLYWVCQGKSNAEIAVILRISGRTVTFHMSAVLKALGASNRTEAATMATAHLASLL